MPDTLNPAWKTGNYLNNILCLREARARGADEVVICNHRGDVTEAAVSNIGFVSRGSVVTPPLDAGILAGITRQLLIHHVAPAAGVAVYEKAIKPADISKMDECFLLSSTKDITPVSAVDEYTFPMAETNITLKLKQAFAVYVKSYCSAHPELRLFD
jgi:branched-chain amino acid aminotransferase